MGLIEKSFGIKRTFENMNRFREIISVMARNGFDEIILQTGLNERIPNFVLPKAKLRINKFETVERKDLWHSVGLGLRKSFEELGPSFIKIGQLLCTRDDLFDESFIKEMLRLRDKVIPAPFSDIEPFLEKSLGGTLESKFKEFNKVPIGTASIGVVFEAKLHTDEEVVVKVRRPNISDSIDHDFEILIFVVSQIEKVIEEFKFLGVSKVLKDFHVSLNNELDFNIEALNCKRLSAIIKSYDTEGIYYVPKIYTEFTKPDLLVIEKINGIPFSDEQRINEVLPIVQKQLEKSLGIFIKTVLIDGFFHADLHGGNFFLLKDHKIAIIDFGLVGVLGKKNRLNFVSIIYSLITHNFENLVYEFLDVAEYEKIPDVDILIKDIRDSLSPFVGLTVKQTNLSLVLRKILTILSKHQVYLPREWFIIFRAMVTLEGVGNSLDMDIDLLSLMEGEIGGIIKHSFSKEEVLEEGVWLARDVMSSLRMFPRHFRWFIKDFAKKGYSVDINNVGLNDMVSKLSKSVNYLAVSFFSGILFLAGCLIINTPKFGSFYQIPILSYIFWFCSLSLFLKVLLKR